jgi:thiamine kinase-like enzyme
MPYMTLIFDESISPDQRTRVSDLFAAWSLPGMTGPVHVKPLAGGANNVNLKVSASGRDFALKLRDQKGVAASNAKVHEAIQGQRLAHSLGVAPAVYAASPDGDFLSDFIVGKTLRPEIIRQEDHAPGMVASLLKLHRAPLPKRRFRLDDDIRTFMTGACAVGAIIPVGFDELLRMSFDLNDTIVGSSAPVSFIHADLVPQNFMASDHGVMLVDFDYCGQGLTVIDISGATSQAEMTDEESEAFMRLYDPALDDAQRARVQCVQFINAIREVAWSLMAEGTMGGSTTIFGDWSYASHRETNLDLARGLLAGFDLTALKKQICEVRPGARF